MALYRDAPLEELGAAADAVVRRRYGDDVTYNVNAHLNPTNICVVGCGFCAFAVWTEKDERAYAYSVDQLVDRAVQLAELGITELHIVGGMTKEYDLPYYEELFTELKATLPHVSLTALTAVEVDFIARISKVAERRGPAPPARRRPRHDAGRRRGGLQPARAQDHRRPQGAGRDLARGPPGGPRPGPAHQRDPPVRALRDARGAGRPHAPAARAAGRHGRLPGVHPAALPARQHRLRVPARADARGEAAHHRDRAPLPRQLPPHQGPLGDARRGDHRPRRWASGSTTSRGR